MVHGPWVRHRRKPGSCLLSRVRFLRLFLSGVDLLLVCSPRLMPGNMCERKLDKGVCRCERQCERSSDHARVSACV